MDDNKMIIISPSKSKQFLEDSKKNVISPEFLKECQHSARLLNKNKFVNMTKEDFKEMNEVSKSARGLSRISLDEI